MPENKTAPADLNGIMEIDRVIHVDASGVVTVKNGGFYAPMLDAVTDEYGQCTADHDQSMRDQAHDAGWELLSGWSCQYGYHGPEMHSSEYVGGALAEHILATPGFWVAVAVGYPDDSGHGWCLAWREDVTLDSPVEPAPVTDQYEPYPVHHAHPSGVTELSENEAVELALSVGNRQGELFQFASGHRFDPIIAMAEARFNGPQDQTTSSLLLFLARYLVADITGVPWARRSDDLDAVNWLRASTEDRTN